MAVTTRPTLKEIRSATRPAWLSRTAAAAYLDMSPVCFDVNVRPHVPESKGGGDPRWSAQDLDDYMASRKIALGDPLED